MAIPCKGFIRMDRDLVLRHEYGRKTAQGVKDLRHALARTRIGHHPCRSKSVLGAGVPLVYLEDRYRSAVEVLSRHVPMSWKLLS